MKVSDKDKELLTLLIENARMPVAEIARRLGVSRPTAQARLDRLEHGGIIEGYGVRFSEAHESGLARAHVMVVLKPKSLTRMVRSVAALPEVQSIHSVSGAFDLIVEVAAQSILELDRLIDMIGELEGVERTESSVILSTRFRR